MALRRCRLSAEFFSIFMSLILFILSDIYALYENHVHTHRISLSFKYHLIPLFMSIIVK